MERRSCQRHRSVTNLPSQQTVISNLQVEIRKLKARVKELEEQQCPCSSKQKWPSHPVSGHNWEIGDPLPQAFVVTDES